MSTNQNSPIISLREFIDQLEMVNDELNAYLNRRTGEFVTLDLEWQLEVERLNEEGGDPLERYNYEWQKEMYKLASDILYSEDYLMLPTSYDIHEYSIMEDYCYEAAPDHLQDKLLDAISGHGAFRRFKNLIYRHGIEKEWYAFRQQAYKAIAIDWLEEHGFPYKDDVGT